jgi:(1->4)-alpha-D-glucan 1-alpha-D-glucosylmutase
LLYQTLLGAWPVEKKPDLDFFRERILNYMQKAAREAKSETSWLEPDAEYESSLHGFINNILKKREFLTRLMKIERKVRFFGFLNSLSQTVIKIASPGVPDFYQGSELWDFNLVDPDNRRGVDFEERKRSLERVTRDFEQLPREDFLRRLMKGAPGSGEIKLFVTWQALLSRREHGALYLNGDYVPLEASGKGERYLCAFSRRHKEQEVIIVAPRLVLSLAEGREIMPVGESVWSDTTLMLPEVKVGTQFRERFTGTICEVVCSNAEPGGAPGGVLNVASVLSVFPVALLEKLDGARDLS